MADKIIICGAGVAGIATAFYLSRESNSFDITIIDKLEPLSSTSSKSGENFRDFWPHPCMEALSSHSIDLMRELHAQHKPNPFRMEFSGYHFVSHNPDAPIFQDENTLAFRETNEVVLDQEEILSKYPYLDKGIKKSVFINNAGNIDSITMANCMLNSAKQKGVNVIKSEIIGISSHGDGFRVLLKEKEILLCQKIVIAAGPFIGQLAEYLDIDLPIWNTFQRKFIIPDPENVIPSDMPFTIYADPQILKWEKEEKEYLNSEGLNWMTETMPGAIHIKPEGGEKIKMGWAYSKQHEIPKWEMKSDELFPQIVMRGASKFIPGLKKYIDNLPSPIIQYGGFYTRTQENWPLIGPLKVKNAFIVGALAGFGTMTACAAGELCVQHLLQMRLPWYAPYFHPGRYKDPKMREILKNADVDGQL